MPSITLTHTHVRYSRAHRFGNTTQAKEGQECRKKIIIISLLNKQHVCAPNIPALLSDCFARALCRGADNMASPSMRCTFRALSFSFKHEGVMLAITHTRATLTAHAHPLKQMSSSFNAVSFHTSCRD